MHPAMRGFSAAVRSHCAARRTTTRAEQPHQHACDSCVAFTFPRLWGAYKICFLSVRLYGTHFLRKCSTAMDEILHRDGDLSRTRRFAFWGLNRWIPKPGLAPRVYDRRFSLPEKVGIFVLKLHAPVYSSAFCEIKWWWRRWWWSPAHYYGHNFAASLPMGKVLHVVFSP